MKLLEKLIKVVENVLIIMFAIMAVLVFGNVILRYGFNSGIVYSEEVSRFLFVWLTLIGALIVLSPLCPHSSQILSRFCHAARAGMMTC